MDNLIRTGIARLVVIALLLQLGGCDLFNSKDKNPPTAAFSASSVSGNAPLSVTFNDNSDAGSKDIFQWHWDFGDGNTSSRQSPSHEYTTPGQYTVSLTVTSDHGVDTLTQSQLINVLAVPPVAAFSQDVTEGDAPLTVTFTDSSTKGTGDINLWQWDFGDGNISTESSPSHTYTTPGSYTVTLTVADEYSSDAVTGAQQIMVYAVPPEAAMDASVTSGDMPLTVNFSDTSTAGTGTVSEWFWDFGDGTTSTEQHPTHIYTEAGSYTVSLTVTADGSDTVQQSNLITVTDPYVYLTLNLRGAEFEVVNDVIVVSDTMTVNQVAHNEYQQAIVQLVPQETSGVLRVQKQGYTDAIVFLSSMQMDTSKNVTMKRQSQPFTVDPTVGGDFVTQDGAAVNVPPYSLVDSEGNIVTEAVELYVTTVDVSDATDRNAFPGAFMGEPDALPGENVEIASYGTVEMTFKRGSDTLQVAEGVTMELEVPLFVASHLGGMPVFTGDYIPFWILNEDTGIWEQEGTGEVVASTESPTGFALKATTSHFSWFNADAWGNPNASPLPFGAGIPGDERSLWCNLSIDVTGPKLGDKISARLVRTSIGWPFSAINNTIIYRDLPIESRLMSGSYYTMTLRNEDNDYAQQSFVCRGEDINLSMSLPDSNKPQFAGWEASLTPIFEVVDSKQTITKNKLTVGGGFIQDEDDLVEVYSLSIPNGGTRLPDGAQVSYEVSPDDVSPFGVYALLENVNGESRRDYSFDYIDSQVPFIRNFSFQNIGENESVVKWKSEGADNIDVFYAEAAPSTRIILVGFDTQIDQEGSLTIRWADFNVESPAGQILMRFGNQYGEVEYTVEVSDGDVCVTDLCIVQ